MSLPNNIQQACKILLESEIAMKILHLSCVDFTWNDPFMKYIYTTVPFAIRFGVIVMYLYFVKQKSISVRGI
jgi:uncharacterized membrane protein